MPYQWLGLTQFQVQWEQPCYLAGIVLIWPYQIDIVKENSLNTLGLGNSYMDIIIWILLYYIIFYIIKHFSIRTRKITVKKQAIDTFNNMNGYQIHYEKMEKAE